MVAIKKFFVNAQEFYTETEITLLNLVQYFNYTDTLIVLEYNNSICNKKNWHTLFLKNNDKIEIVTIVGGG